MTALGRDAPRVGAAHSEEDPRGHGTTQPHTGGAIASDHQDTTSGTPRRADRTGPLDSERVGIVGDHQLVVETLRAALVANGFTVEPAAGGHARVVILDIDPASGPGQELRGDSTDLIVPLRHGGAAVLAITGVADPARRDLAVALGAAAVLPKTTALAEILVVVRRLAAGQEVISPVERSAARRRDALVAPARRRELRGLARLSPRESQVLACLVEGHTVDEIAARRCVQPSTVRAQVRSILVKLGVPSQLQAVALVHRRSWPLPPSGWGRQRRL